MSSKKKTSKKVAVKKVSTKKVSAVKKAAKVKRVGLLETAFRILCKSAEPLCVRDMMKQVSKSYTPPHGGLTVDRSLSAALGRAVKVKDAKIIKAGKGLFSVKK